MIRLAILENTAKVITDHLLRSGDIEQGVFCLVRLGKGNRGVRLLVTEVLLPPADAWEYQERDILRPSARWISSAVSRAIETQSGLLFIHSHPHSQYPIGLSSADIVAFCSLAKTLTPCSMVPSRELLYTLSDGQECCGQMALWLPLTAL